MIESWERKTSRKSTVRTRRMLKVRTKERSLIFSIYILIIVSFILFVVDNCDLFIYF